MKERLILLVTSGGFEVALINEWDSRRHISYGLTITEALQRAQTLLGHEIMIELQSA